MLRRAKNRRKDGQGVSFPVPVAAGIVLVGVMSLLYVWLDGRCEAAGSRIKALENQKVEVHKKVMIEEYKWCTAKSPRNIERLLRQFKLNMQYPEETQIVRLRYKPAEPETRETAFRRGGGADAYHD